MRLQIYSHYSLGSYMHLQPTSTYVPLAVSIHLHLRTRGKIYDRFAEFLNKPLLSIDTLLSLHPL